MSWLDNYWTFVRTKALKYEKTTYPRETVAAASTGTVFYLNTNSMNLSTVFYDERPFWSWKCWGNLRESWKSWREHSDPIGTAYQSTGTQVFYYGEHPQKLYTVFDQNTFIPWNGWRRRMVNATANFWMFMSRMLCAYRRWRQQNPPGSTVTQRPQPPEPPPPPPEPPTPPPPVIDPQPPGKGKGGGGGGSGGKGGKGGGGKGGGKPK